MIRFCLLAWVSLSVLFSSSAYAGKRVALVIGNSAYALAPLVNPQSDAEDVAAALTRLQFDVMARTDLTAAAFDEALDSFEVKAKGADVAFFFFSGHGVQIDKRGYLAPIDVKAESESSALRELVSVQEVVSRIENAAKISVILLDACRDSPLHERLRRVEAERNRSFFSVKGLPPVSITGSNTLVVYATVPGETASDGAGRNSPFTAAFLRNIETPGLEIEQMFKHVTMEVLKDTDGKQQPERLSRLQSELVLLESQTLVLPPKGEELKRFEEELRRVKEEARIARAAAASAEQKRQDAEKAAAEARRSSGIASAKPGPAGGGEGQLADGDPAVAGIQGRSSTCFATSCTSARDGCLSYFKAQKTYCNSMYSRCLSTGEWLGQACQLRGLARK
jgi:uncharacterized caspase-like protein